MCEIPPNPLLMIVDDLDVFRAFLGPAEAHTILVVDANTVLSSPIPFEGF